MLALMNDLTSDWATVPGKPPPQFNKLHHLNIQLSKIK